MLRLSNSLFMEILLVFFLFCFCFC